MAIQQGVQDGYGKGVRRQADRGVSLFVVIWLFRALGGGYKMLWLDSSVGWPGKYPAEGARMGWELWQLLPEGLALEHVAIDGRGVTIEARCIVRDGKCSVCGQPSSRIHRYCERTLTCPGRGGV